MSRFPAIFPVIAFGLALTVPASAVQGRRAGLVLTKVMFRPLPSDPLTFQAFAGKYRLVLHEPDAPVEPTSWESPLTVINTRTGFRFDTTVSAIEAVFLVPGRSLLVVVAGGDGARATVSFVDPATGRDRFPMLAAISDGTTVEGNRIIFDAAVERAAPDGVSRCHAARVYRFDGIHPPVLNPAASLALTVKQIGVGFTGSRRVAFPRTEKARLTD